ncbi:hypothetical protein CLU79DRAFT_749439 [Phycomyces nitens]|nr:hypothetical protein CLU79DRAFT_749439 [Phycomyces nitens]
MASSSDCQSQSNASKDESIQVLIESFLKEHTAYDVLPVSYRLVVFDTSLLVKRALTALMQNGIVSAPLWSSKTQKFAGMLMVADFIKLIQYYYAHASDPDTLLELDILQIQDLRDPKRHNGTLAPQQLLSMHPMASLHEACRLLAESRAHRVALLDRDESACGTEMIVSVITQYRLLKFIAVNFKQTDALKQTLGDLQIGTYGSDVATATVDTPVIEIINTFAEMNISAIPIVDENGVVLNVYETVDVMSIAKSGLYNKLNVPVGEVLDSRPADYVGVHTCTLESTLQSIFNMIRKQRTYRLVIIDDESKLVGIVSLSDILGYLVGYKK